ncbi:MAG: gliding motility-associated C-terminal domain-containing protein, partial [Bacteroidales bacterium]|nr:gliding motility-associated C-terminal domain-containing protein [Bacteroidales bacterium]
FNQSSVLWATTGDGLFNNVAVLGAIYTPGINDILNGSVDLILTSNAIGPCTTSATDTMTLFIQLLPLADAGADATICEDETYTLTGTASIQSSILWTTAGDGVFDDATILGATYTPGPLDKINGIASLTLTASAIGPCTAAATDIITLFIQLLPVPGAGPDDAICEYETYTLNGTAANQSSILWLTAGDGTFNNINILNPVYTPGGGDIAAGSVVLSLQLFGVIPCGDSIDSMILTINPEPAPVISGSIEECENACVDYSTPNVSGNTYTWVVTGGIITGGIGTNQITVCWGLFGTGTVTLTETVGATGCFITTAPYDVTINPLPNVFSVTGGGSSCDGGTGIDVGLFASELGVNYQLQLNNVDFGLPTVGTGVALNYPNQTDAGTYTIIATNTVTGCIDTMAGNAIIVINPLPVVYNVTGGGSYCAGFLGLAVGLDGSQNGISYQMQLNNIDFGLPVVGTGAAFSFGNQTAAGTYTVIATTPLGCVDTMNASVDIIINPLPTQFTVTGGGTYCAGGIGVDVGVDSTEVGIDYQLLINGVNTGAALVGIDAPISFGNQTAGGTYTVIATNPITSCSDTMIDSVLVIVAPLPLVFNVTGGGAYCVGGPGRDIGLDGSEIGIEYFLTLGGFTQVDSTMGTGIAISFGNQTTAGNYIVTAVDTATGCSSLMSGDTNIIINPAPTVSFSGLAANYCANDPADTLTGSEYPFGVFNSSLGAGLVDYGNGKALFSPALAGVGGPYDITYSYANSLGCQDDTIMQVTVNPIPNANAGQDTTICIGQPAFLAATGGNTFLWSTGNVTPSITVNPVIQTTYYVTVSQFGCSNDDSVTVFVNVIPVADAGTDVDICVGANVTLTASGGTNYEWNTVPPVYVEQITVVPMVTTTYVVTVSDDIGCSDSDDVTVDVHDIPLIWTAPGGPAICRDSSIVITANGAVSYSWDPVEGLSSPSGTIVTASPTITTTYSITGTSFYGCVGSGSVTVTVYPTPTPKISDSTYLCLGETLTLDAGRFDGWHWYLWNDGSSTQRINIDYPGLYWVKVANPGCSVTDTIIVNQCTEIWVPNAFTPNGNYVNDVFKAQASTEFEEFHLNIYNRWGQQVFESDNIHIGWDGTYKGSICPEGVYIWVIKYLGMGNHYLDKEGMVTGHVTLLK